jgi:hypothetical protein
MRDELARSMLSLATAIIVPALVVLVTRIAKRIWPDPATIEAAESLARLKMELRREIAQANEDSKEMIRRSRERIALDHGRPKTFYDSTKPPDLSQKRKAGNN